MTNLHEMVVDMEKAQELKPIRSLETARRVELAHQDTIVNSLRFETPLLFQMQMAVLLTDDGFGFITSDRPCVWFNPSLYKLPPFYRSPGLGQKHVEVTLPLTPRHMLFISHTECPEYVEVSQTVLDESNRLTRACCSEEFVSWKGETRPHWFDPGKEPEDTWEKSEEGKRALALRDDPSKSEDSGSN